MRRVAAACSLLAVLLVAATGCSRGGGTPAEAVVTDSAGVRMVVNRGVSFGGGVPQWRVGARPDLVIGAVDGAAEYMFDRIMGLERLSDGRWAVADMGSSQVRYYDARGRHLSSVGGSGDGPGEFRQIMGLRRHAGDTLLVDDRYERYQILDEAGRFSGQMAALGRMGAERTTPLAALADGSFLAYATPATPRGPLTDPVMLVHSLHRARMERDDGDGIRLVLLDTLGVWNLIELVPGWRGEGTLRRFEAPTEVRAASDGFVLGNPMQFELRRYNTDGTLRLVSRTEWDPPRVTRAHIDEARAAFTGAAGGSEQVTGGLQRQRQEIADAWVFAEHLPAFAAMLVDDIDHVWLREYLPDEATVGTWTRAPVVPSHWIVFDADGIMDVEYIHSYPLTRQ